jgi:hypothetical protein
MHKTKKMNFWETTIHLHFHTANSILLRSKNGISKNMDNFPHTYTFLTRCELRDLKIVNFVTTKLNVFLVGELNLFCRKK